MKKLKFLPLVFLALPCLTGCGEKDDPNVVEFWHTFGQKTAEAVNKVASDFNALMATKGVNVTIKPSYQGGYDDIHRKVFEGLAVGNTPTIAVAYPDHVADYLYEDNGKYVYKLDDYFESETIGFGKQDYLGELSSTDDFFSSFINEGTHFAQTGTYTLPFMKSSEALFYNKTYLQKAYGIWKQNASLTLEAAETWLRSASWSEFMEFCNNAAQHRSEISNVLAKEDAYILGYDSDANLIITRMYQDEIAFTSIQDGKGHLDFEDATEKAKLKTVVEEYKTLHSNHVLITKGSNSGKYGSDLFKNLKCIFTVGSTGGSGYNDPGAQFDPGVCKVPASNDNPLYISQGPTLTFLRNGKKSNEINDHRMELAWQFAKYLTSPEVNTYMCVYGSEGYLPVSYDACDTANYITFLQDDGLASKSNSVLFNDIGDKYINSPVFKGSATLRTEMENLVKDVLNGAKGVDAAIEDTINKTKMDIK